MGLWERGWERALTQINSRSLRDYASSMSAPRSRACASLHIFARTGPRERERARRRRLRRGEQRSASLKRGKVERKARREIRCRHGRDRVEMVCRGRWREGVLEQIGTVRLFCVLHMVLTVYKLARSLWKITTSENRCTGTGNCY